MSKVKTTVYLEASEYRRLKALATVEGRSAAELIRVAVAEFMNRSAPRTLPRSLGGGSSSDGRVAASAEELLRGLGSS